VAVVAVTSVQTAAAVAAAVAAAAAAVVVAVAVAMAVVAMLPPSARSPFQKASRRGVGLGVVVRVAAGCGVTLL